MVNFNKKPGNNIIMFESLIRLGSMTKSQIPIYPLEYKSTEVLNLSQREVYFQWIFDTATDLKLPIKTSFLACTYLDIFFNRRAIPSVDNLEVLGLVCLHLAHKYTESGMIQVSTLASMLKGRYSIIIINEIELYVLKTLEWRLDIITLHDIIEEIIPEGFNNRTKIVNVATCYSLLLFIEGNTVNSGICNIALISVSTALERLKADIQCAYDFKELGTDLEIIQELDRVLKSKIDECNSTYL